MATSITSPAMPGTQTLRLRKQPDASTKPAAPRRDRHAGLLQDQLRRSQRGPWTPGLSVAFRMLIMIRVGAAMYSNIQDCDEVFNFFEPLHYLFKGYAFQTWELSPEYAIRSWAYILLHFPATLVPGLLNATSKRTSFFAVRIALGAVCSFCEAKFYRTVVEQMNYRLGRYLLFMLMFSAGMWNASTAFLPSSFAMYTTMMACSYWFKPASNTDAYRTLATTVYFALGAIVGWPFALAIAIPYVFEELVVYGHDKVADGEWRKWFMARLTRLIGCGVVAATIFIPVVGIDSLAYDKLTITPWNIIHYNILGGSERGPDLYGTEPWYFYFLNLILNFNILLPLALVSIPALGITYRFDRRRLGLTRPGRNESSPFTLMALRLLPFYLWLGILTAQQHKEERFMYPVYPLLCFNAATTIYLARGWLETTYVYFTKSPYQASKASLFPWATFSIVLLSAIIGISRILALYQYYHAPMDVVSHFEFSELPRLLNVTGLLPEQIKKTETPSKYDKENLVDLTPIHMFNLNLCIGKEWYRFPSHFHVPDSINVNFIKSEFDGMLPRHFVESAGSDALWKWDGTRFVPPDLNDLNREEPSRYVEPSTCDYLIDLDFPDRGGPPSPLEPRYAIEEKSWERVACYKFVDAANSNPMTKLLWVPLSEWTSLNSYGDYCLLKNKARAKARESKIWASP
ncbi:glycosyltransferase family 22 protein [Calocera viscosa TUFC12733]|uniref:Mannosyltransferase n=1 Tax=Calocera viscosa (strain TUFC12733) TaxID=1330018 RepID=A0A167M4Z8_CALVF|nr:glycosyltransferase family 22 protein [Calocera viscosa TUFC12733]